MRHCLWLWLLVLFAAPVHAAAETLPVTLTGFTGLPADSSDRKEFMDAFRAAMDSDLPCEKRAGDAWSASGLKRNVFRLVDMAAPEAAWTLDITLGLPVTVRVTRAKKKGSKHAPRPRMSDVRVSRGLTIFVAALSPSAAAQGARPIPLRFAVYFADAQRILIPSAKLPSGGYDYPWEQAGRVVAAAALETLHRANDTLADDERADLSPATRTEDAP